MKKYAIGIDVGGRSVKFGLFDKDGKLFDKSNIKTRTENNGSKILDDTYQHILEILEKHDLTVNDLYGVGIGVPGPVLNQSTIKTAVNLGWGEINISQYLESKLDTKVLVANDANVAALGESWMGVAQGLDNIVMLTLGTGLGGAVIVNGQIVSGRAGAGGEIGHMPILEKGLSKKCNCGKDTCFELVASASGIENIANEILFESDQDSVLRNIDTVLAKDIFEALKEGDLLSDKIVDIYSNHLARGIAILSAILDPDMIVIGGGVSNAGQTLLERIKDKYKIHALNAVSDLDIEIATLGNDAGIYGAAKLVL